MTLPIAERAATHHCFSALSSVQGTFRIRFPIIYAVPFPYIFGSRNGGDVTASQEPGRFAGRVAIVTGSASGIGRETARRLAIEGAALRRPPPHAAPTPSASP